MGRAAALMVGGLAVACGAPRPQLVISLTTDLALPEQVISDETRSAGATLDRVRVEVLGAGTDDSVSDSREFVVREAASMPLSFGVARGAGAAVRLRITGYRDRWTTRQGDRVVPAPGTSVERLVWTTIGDGIARLDVVLRGDCLGRPADLAAGTTCVDGTHLAQAADSAATETAATPATWAPSLVVPCSGAAPAGMVCVAGGVSTIGDPALAVVDSTSDLVAAPARVVVVAPFFVDRLEVTVAELRALVTAGTLTGTLPTTSASDGRCNYSTTAGAADDQAVRCVPLATARAACVARGGDLPTASQWEHAARGRGRATRYPWGDETPTCCAAALAGGALGCKPSLDVGAHADPAQCAGLADASRDDVLDLAGSVREWVLDAPASFDSCLGPGVLQDPLCVDTALGAGSTKGGSYATPLEGASAALRRRATDNLDVGFRCVRPAR